MKFWGAPVVISVVMLLATYRTKGSLVEFHNMIVTLTSRSSFSYLGYGNYCGLGGSGPVVDSIDRCCKQHDRCIAAANRHECLIVFFLGMFTVYYDWNLHNGEIVCSKLNWDCGLQLCHCDKEAAECFALYDNEYNFDNKGGGLSLFG